MNKLITLSVIALSLIMLSFANAQSEDKVTLMVTHEVKDFDIWKKGFIADGDNRKKAGFTLLGLYRALDKPNVVTILFEATNAETVNKFLSNPELKASMEKAGVISAPDIKILSKVK